MLKRITHKLLLEKANFNDDWRKSQKLNLNNFYISFLIKWWIVRLIRIITKKSFDNNLGLLKLLVSILLSVPRDLAIRLIRFLDRTFPPFFGAIHTKTERKINIKGISNIYQTSNPNVDMRILFWKVDALQALINIINEKKMKDLRVVEIGAANGIVSMMLAEWSKNNYLDFSGVCVEPNFSNIDFLQQMIIKNNYNIKVMPCVINDLDKWTDFEDAGSRGLVSNAIKNKKKILQKYSVSIDELMSCIFKPNIIYIDALKNENYIVNSLINIGLEKTILLIEFDNGISNELKEKCDKLKLKIDKIDDYHHYAIYNN